MRQRDRRSLVKAAVDAELLDTHAAAAEVALSTRQPQNAHTALRMLQQIRSAHARIRTQSATATSAQHSASSPGGGAQQAAVAAAVAAVSRAGKAASLKDDNADDDDYPVQVG